MVPAVLDAIPEEPDDQSVIDNKVAPSALTGFGPVSPVAASSSTVQTGASHSDETSNDRTSSFSTTQSSASSPPVIDDMDDRRTVWSETLSEARGRLARKRSGKAKSKPPRNSLFNMPNSTSNFLGGTSPTSDPSRTKSNNFTSKLQHWWKRFANPSRRRTSVQEDEVTHSVDCNCVQCLPWHECTTAALTSRLNSAAMSPNVPKTQKQLGKRLSKYASDKAAEDLETLLSGLTVEGWKYLLIMTGSLKQPELANVMSKWATERMKPAETGESRRWSAHEVCAALEPMGGDTNVGDAMANFRKRADNTLTQSHVSSSTPRSEPRSVSTVNPRRPNGSGPTRSLGTTEKHRTAKADVVVPEVTADPDSAGTSVWDWPVKFGLSAVATASVLAGAHGYLTRIHARD